MYPFNEQFTMDIIIQTDKTMYPLVETHLNVLYLPPTTFIVKDKALNEWNLNNKYDIALNVQVV
jgi:hypothetical protein